MDLDLEHDKLLFKDSFVTFRGELTDSTLTRASRSIYVMDNVIQLYDKNTAVVRPSGRPTRVNRKEDIDTFVSKIVTPKSFKVCAGRTYALLPSIKSNPLLDMRTHDLKKWIKA